jgi:serpin B
MSRIVLLSFFLTASTSFAATNLMETSATAINLLGLDLLARTGQPTQNAVISPYSIQCALAMAYAGADGVTLTQMANALHYPSDEAGLHRSFAALQQALDELAKKSAERAEQMKQYGARDPITLTVANRLFGQEGYEFRAAFLALTKDNYRAPFQPLDFVHNAEVATKTIDAWVEDQTHQRIKDIIPTGSLDKLTRLVLVNAIYLKAPWNEPFEVSATQPRPFHVAGGKTADVPTMSAQHAFGYSKRPGFTLLSLPYSDYELRFVIFLPDDIDGLAGLQRSLSNALLTESNRLDWRDVILYLPKFKIEPSPLALGGTLRALGMKSAFDDPPRSANFERMAPRRPDDYLYLSEVFHKTFLSLDEKGTEAAAATALVFATASAVVEKPKPIEVHVDRPFLFAIQHAPSGACLFLGRVSDPR